MNQYRCETCTNKDDCDEYESQAVRDVSIRCGLTCHSDFQSERYRPVCYPDCENEKRIRKDAQETVIDRVILEMVYSEKGFPKTVKEFSERITQLRQQAGE